MLVSLQPFRFVSIMMLSHPLVMLWGLLSIWIWLLWSRRQKHGWALLLGVFVGWAAITRPLDALCFALPIGAGILWDLPGKATAHWLVTFGLIAGGAAPFLTVQFIEDYGITGNLLDTPHYNYSAHEYPGMVLGFMPFNPEWKQPSSLLQKQDYYDYFIVPGLKSHTAGSIVPNLYKSRLPMMLQTDLPDTLLLILVPMGILGLTDPRRWVIWSTLPSFLGAYSCFPAFLMQYALPAALPLVLTLVLGIRTVAETWPGRQRAIGTILTLLLASFAMTTLPGFNPNAYDQGWSWPVMTAAHTRLPQEVQTPAVVLFPYHPRHNFHEEPVSNVDVAWPDDEPIIHLQDLGMERDREIAAYYAKTQPDRDVYVFDRRRLLVIPQGKPKDFLAYLKDRRAPEAPSRRATEPARR